MITGIISVYPKFGNETFIDLKTKLKFRNISGIINSDGEDIEIKLSIKETLYEKFSQYFIKNAWSKSEKFIVWGSLRNLPKDRSGSIFFKIDFIEKASEYPEIEDINLFSLNAHLTKKTKIDESGNFKLFKVAANKSILNKKEKTSKSATYIYLKTTMDNELQDKDLITGSVSLGVYENRFVLKPYHIVPYTTCRELSETFIQLKS